jgi:hypothetical protein
MGPGMLDGHGPRLPSGRCRTARSSPGAPHRAEGCLPASRGLALALMTCVQCRKRCIAQDNAVKNMVKPGNGAEINVRS